MIDSCSKFLGHKSNKNCQKGEYIGKFSNDLFPCIVNRRKVSKYNLPGN